MELEIDFEKYNQRFGGIARIYGTKGLHRLLNSTVMVVGLGGIGSWAVESLVRSGVGKIILVDLDDVCITNTNRQICATNETIGILKAEALKTRAKLINPDVQIEIIENFYTPKTSEEILSRKIDYIIDAIDSSRSKSFLISEAIKKQIPIIVTGGAAGKIDPSQIKIEDIAFAVNDKLLFVIRKDLRKHHGFKRPKGASLSKRVKMGIKCIYSPEEPRYPTKDGEVCSIPDPDTNLKLDCESGLGSVTHLTGTFGFFAASEVIKELAQTTN